VNGPVLVVERADWHTHSERTDGTASASAMADAAVRAGLKLWGLSDHVRADTTWLPDYVEATRSLRRDGLQIRCGVEAKLLDVSGRLDLPPRLPTLDYVLVADHQFPGRDAAQPPATVRAAIENATLTAADVVADLIAATSAGIRRSPFRPIVAHLFSLLPKMGLSEADVTDEHLRSLASACLDSGGAVEVNEKWRCPSTGSVAYLASAGVPITAGSDAHRVEDVGRCAYLDAVLADIGTGTTQGGSDRPVPRVASSP
jgi:putative hydrolase